MRYYDLSICYDSYYLCPRLFFAGVTEDNRPLKQNEIFEDILSEKAHKTVTMLAHSGLGI